MKRALLALAALLALGVGLVAAGNVGLGPVVITREDEQKIILFLSQARRVTKPGLSLRWPLLETAATYDRRWLYWTARPTRSRRGTGSSSPSTTTRSGGSATRSRSGAPSPPARRPRRRASIARCATA
jgi:hypothetical protein